MARNKSSKKGGAKKKSARPAPKESEDESAEEPAPAPAVTAKLALFDSESEDESDASAEEAFGPEEGDDNGSNDDDSDVGADDDSDSDSEADLEEKSLKIREKLLAQHAENMQQRKDDLTEDHDQADIDLPTSDERVREEVLGADLQSVRGRIQDIVGVLSDFRRRRHPDKSRKEYMEALEADVVTYFGYLPELAKMLMGLFSPAEALQFFEANEEQRPVVLRTNSLKTTRRRLAQNLIARGVSLDPVGDWTKIGLKVHNSRVPLGATPEYLAGHYMLQSSASFLPVMALDPQPGERVLDMCASPGGKTTHIAQRMRNKGLIIANDIRKDRVPGLAANIARLGVQIAVVTNYDGRQFPKVTGGFNRVLLDAPCSGLGVISKDPAVKLSRSQRDIEITAHLQKELLCAAVDSVDAAGEGSIIVYSTCSVSVAENEEVVDYILRKRCVKLVPTGLSFGKPGFSRFGNKRYHPSLNLTRRFYPHVHNTDGFYVAKLFKYANTISEGQKKTEGQTQESESEDESEDETISAAKPGKLQGRAKGKVKVQQSVVIASGDSKKQKRKQAKDVFAQKAKKQKHGKQESTIVSMAEAKKQKPASKGTRAKSSELPNKQSLATTKKSQKRSKKSSLLLLASESSEMEIVPAPASAPTKKKKRKTKKKGAKQDASKDGGDDQVEKQKTKKKEVAKPETLKDGGDDQIAKKKTKKKKVAKQDTQKDGGDDQIAKKKTKKKKVAKPETLKDGGDDQFEKQKTKKKKVAKQDTQQKDGGDDQIAKKKTKKKKVAKQNTQKDGGDDQIAMKKTKKKKKASKQSEPEDAREEQIVGKKKKKRTAKHVPKDTGDKQIVKKNKKAAKHNMAQNDGDEQISKKKAKKKKRSKKSSKK